MVCRSRLLSAALTEVEQHTQSVTCSERQGREKAEAQEAQTNGVPGARDASSRNLHFLAVILMFRFLLYHAVLYHSIIYYHIPRSIPYWDPYVYVVFWALQQRMQVQSHRQTFRSTVKDVDTRTVTQPRRPVFGFGVLRGWGLRDRPEFDIILRLEMFGTALTGSQGQDKESVSRK